MALNDFLRIVSGPGGGLDIVVGSSRLQIREGKIILPQRSTAAEAGTEVGSMWNNSDTGKNRQNDSGGTRDDT